MRRPQGAEPRTPPVEPSPKLDQAEELEDSRVKFRIDRSLSESPEGEPTPKSWRSVAADALDRAAGKRRRRAGSPSRTEPALRIEALRRRRYLLVGRRRRPIDQPMHFGETRTAHSSGF